MIATRGGWRADDGWERAAGALSDREQTGVRTKAVFGAAAPGALQAPPVGKRDVEGETHRDVRPKQYGAERRGGRRRECCPTHRQKEGAGVNLQFNNKSVDVIAPALM